MTIDELFEQTQRAFHERMEAEKERAKRRNAAAQSYRFKGRHGDLEEVSNRMGVEAVRRVQNSRYYAIDDRHAPEFGAQCVAAAQAGMNPVGVIKEIATAITELLGDLPNACTPWLKHIPAKIELPVLPTDPVTGQRLHNPFLKPVDARSARVIEELHPRLAQWLRDCAKNDGPTFFMRDQLAAEVAENAHEREICEQYDEKMWGENVLAHSTNHTERNLFHHMEDKTLLRVHEREATAGSPTLGFDNLTVRSVIAKRSPELREVHKAAGEILKAWQAEAREEAA